MLFFSLQGPLLVIEAQLAAAARRAGLRVPRPLAILATLTVLQTREFDQGFKLRGRRVGARRTVSARACLHPWTASHLLAVQPAARSVCFGWCRRRPARPRPGHSQSGAGLPALAHTPCLLSCPWPCSSGTPVVCRHAQSRPPPPRAAPSLAGGAGRPVHRSCPSARVASRASSADGELPGQPMQQATRVARLSWCVAPPCVCGTCTKEQARLQAVCSISNPHAM